MIRRVKHTAKHEHGGYIHTEISEQMFVLGFKWGNLKILQSNRERIRYDKIIQTDKFGHPFVLKRGSKTINKSDTDLEGYWIGTVIDFEDYKGKYSGTKRAPALPVVQAEKDGSVYSTFGICVPYNEELITVLDCLSPMEQWNFLCRDHCQVKITQSIRHSRFPVKSNTAIIQWYKNNSKKMYRV